MADPTRVIDDLCAESDELDRLVAGVGAVSYTHLTLPTILLV